MNAIDTNIWVYVHDTRDARKQRVAIELVSTLPRIVLPWQVGCEFIAAARKLKGLGFDERQAWDALEQMRAVAGRVLIPDVVDWKAARSLVEEHSVSFWDGLLIACCLRHGVEAVYSEDLPGGKVEGIRIVNPMA